MVEVQSACTPTMAWSFIAVALKKFDKYKKLWEFKGRICTKLGDVCDISVNSGHILCEGGDKLKSIRILIWYISASLRITVLVIKNLRYITPCSQMLLSHRHNIWHISCP